MQEKLEKVLFYYDVEYFFSFHERKILFDLSILFLHEMKYVVLMPSLSTLDTI